MIDALRMGLSGLAREKVVLVVDSIGQDVMVTEAIHDRELNAWEVYWVEKKELRPLTAMETLAAMTL